MQLAPNSVGAIYHRVSIDRQDADRQRQSTQDWLARHGLAVPSAHVYEDLGWARAAADKRPAFQRLLRDADDGKIKWIVCDALDRFGTKNKHQLVSYLYRLQEADCKLFTVNDKEWTSEDLLTLIEAGVEGEKSEGEGRSKSERVIEKARQKAKRGEWLGGKIPYAMEVVALRLNGNGLEEQWRWRMLGPDRRLKIDIISNTTKEYVGKNNTPSKEYDQTLQLRPTTEEERLQVIRTIFSWYATEAISPHAIAQRLNEQGAPPPAYSKKGQWQHNVVEDILESSCYIGQPSWNKSTKGTYNEWRQGQRHRKKPGQPTRKHAKEDWITPDEPIFDPVVDLETWKIVQMKLDARPVNTRNPKSPNLWLSGLLVCAHCGKPMYGRIEKRRNQAVYYCSTYFTHPKPRSKCPCTINRIEHDKLEEKIQDWLNDTGVDLAKVGAEGRGKRNLPEAFFVASLRMINAKAQMRERVGLPDPPHVDAESILNQFAEVYEQELPQLNERLKALREEQRLAIRSLSRLPDEATHAIATAKREVADLDQQIRDAEAETVNHGERFMAAMQEIAETLKDWQAARDAMTYETSARRKAEAVRKVLAKMILTFTPTGRKRPTSVLTDWVFVPVGINGEASPQSPPSHSPDQPRQRGVNYYRRPGCRSL